MLAHRFAGEFFIYCSLISYCILNCVKLKTKKYIHNNVGLTLFFPAWVWAQTNVKKGSGDSTVGGVLALHAADPGLISSTPYVPSSTL